MISFLVEVSSSVVDAAADAMMVEVLALPLAARFGSEEFLYLLTWDPSAKTANWLNGLYFGASAAAIAPFPNPYPVRLLYLLLSFGLDSLAS